MRRGFSLLEMTIALGVSGVMLAMVWQMMSASGTQSTAALVAGQAQVVARAGQEYLNANKTAVLAEAPAINDVIRIRITSADTGNATLADLQTAGYLPASFVNQNSFGQTYALYAQRQDAGVAGADASDRMVGLLITTGGQVIADDVANQIVSRLGSAGGFFFSSDNPAPTLAATTIRGSAGGWAMSSLTTAPGWSTASGVNSFTTVARAGRLAVATSLLPASAVSAGGSGAGAVDIDGLTDGKTDYSSLYNVFLGSGAGDSNVTGGYSTAIGFGAMQRMTPNVLDANNTAIGYHAMRGWSNSATGTNNVAVGRSALENIFTGSNNVAVGVNAGNQNQTGSNRVLIGFIAGQTCNEDNNTFVGAWTGACTTGFSSGASNTIIGAHSARWRAGSDNALVGAYIGWSNTHTGSRNSALGYEALTAISSTTADDNVAIGYRAGHQLGTGTFNILIGSGANAPLPDSSNRLNIGNYIYGDTNTRQLNLGSSTMVAGIAFDTNATTSSRLASGTTAERPTCGGSQEGAQRWNSQTQTFEFCRSGSWTQPIADYIPAVGTPPLPPSASGYFVMSSGTWNGNMGGPAGANALCLSDLTANDWMGKASAVAAGQLIASKVGAFIGANSYHFPFIPNTTYYFATSGRPSAGGANFTTDNSGNGPGNDYHWSGSNYFDGGYIYWAGNWDGATSTMAGKGMPDAWWVNGNVCQGWSDDGGSNFGNTANTAYFGLSRYWGASQRCNREARLICVVQP